MRVPDDAALPVRRDRLVEVEVLVEHLDAVAVQPHHEPHHLPRCVGYLVYFTYILQSMLEYLVICFDILTQYTDIFYHLHRVRFVVWLQNLLCI